MDVSVTSFYGFVSPFTFTGFSFPALSTGSLSFPSLSASCLSFPSLSTAPQQFFPLFILLSFPSSVGLFFSLLLQCVIFPFFCRVLFPLSFMGPSSFTNLVFPSFPAYHLSPLLLRVLLPFSFFCLSFFPYGLSVYPFSINGLSVFPTYIFGVSPSYRALLLFLSPTR